MSKVNWPSTADILSKSFASKQQERADGEKLKLGFLRAGNSGLLEGNDFAASCPRITFLRMLGMEVDGVDEDQDLMLEGGLGNEELWMDALRREWPGQLKQEEETPIRWETSNGTIVSGRPDIVLCDDEGTPLRGLELKLVCSVWTAKTILGGQPKLAHIVQASHYSWKLGVPFEIWYTSRVNWSIASGWMSKLFPMPGTHVNGNFIETKERKDKQGNVYVEPFKVVPFRIGFELRLQPDMSEDEAPVQFRQMGTREWQTSLVTRKRIRDFYEYVSTMKKRKELGNRPKALKADGLKESYSPCDYCPGMRDICDKHDKFDSWLKEAKLRFGDA